MLTQNFFIYDAENDVIYFHTAGSGYTKNIIEQNNNVCISVANGAVVPGLKGHLIWNGIFIANRFWHC